MRVIYKNDERELRATVYPFDDYNHGIDVVKRRGFDGDFEDAHINWPAIGSSDVETTNTFVEALAMAVGIARRFDTAGINLFEVSWDTGEERRSTEVLGTFLLEAKATVADALGIGHDHDLEARFIRVVKEG